jgi:hypothetical protein
MTTVDEYWEETFDHQRPDLVNNPPHYKHPSGVECIDIAETMTFCKGAALKYLWRAGQKGDEVEDLRKARWFIDREIQRLLSPAASADAEALFSDYTIDQNGEGV